MSGGPNGRHRRVARTILVLALGTACLASAAFAATRSDRERSGVAVKGHGSRDRGDRPIRPRFIETPPARGVGGGYQFRFHIPPPIPRPGNAGPARTAPPAPRWREFECRTDGDGWVGCASPRRLGNLATGDHTFAVRALNRRGLSGPAAHYRWSQLEPKEFEVQLLGSVEDLMPGDSPRQLPVQVRNPNPTAIEVTALTVTVAPEAPGCPADPNFAVTPSSLTPTAPLGVPAGGTATLPTDAAAAPTVALRELPLDQNGCQGAAIRLYFSGEARG